MNHKQKGTLGAAIAITFGSMGTTEAATIELTLRSVLSYSGSGASPGNITSSTATWSYNDVTNVLSQTGGTFNVRFTIAPTTTLFRHVMTGAVLGVPTATASTFACSEGNFGGSVGASLCGNYNFGNNFANESTASWGPGTAFALTVGGDDMSLGPQQSISTYNYFATVSWDGTVLKIGNGSCNPFAPGNANGCATQGGFNAGYSWTLSTPIPAAAWLFGGALGALGWLKRRRVMV